MARQHLLLFGDQTVEIFPSVQRLDQQARKSTLLQRFIREATDVIQTQLTHLSPTEREGFVSFATLLELAHEYADKDDTYGIVQAVLVCTARLGELLARVENDPSILCSSGDKVYALGLCTGILPAAALAAARDASELFKISIEMVAVIFRVALETVRRSRRLEDGPGYWAYSLLATEEELVPVLDEFHASQNIPPHRRAFIGVSSHNWATIFGPPSVMARLFASSPALEAAPKLTVRAYGVAHAPHIPLSDLDVITGNSPLLDTPVSDRVQIISTSTCEVFNAPTLRSLLMQIYPDIFLNTMRISDAAQALARELAGKGDVKLTVVGLTAHTAIVQKALEEKGLAVSLDDLPVLPQPQRVRGGSDQIAIVGMSGRFPGSESVTEFWESLLQAQEFHKKVPNSRFEISDFFDPAGEAKNSIATSYGCFLEHPGLFDTRLFNVSPREAIQMDPLQRLLLMVSYEALEMAGYADNGTISTNTKRIATYIGQATDDWKAINEQQGIDIYNIPGVARAFLPGRLNYHFKFEGPAYNVDSACASSSTAVSLACSALINRECDTALAGGGNILSTPGLYSGLSKGGFLSNTGGCKTFRDDADGYCRGEGIGVIVLKRIEDALHDNDNVLAVINGYAKNHCANAISITHPHAETQEKVYRQVLQKAGAQPDEVAYIEMHGTATAAGDMAEMTSVTNVFGKTRSKDNPLVLGAVKANIGHGEAAAGICSLIKGALILKNGIFPPQPGVSAPLNSKYPPLTKLNIRIADKPMPFEVHSKGGRRKILVNNFDAAGGNTCLLLEEAPKQQNKQKDLRKHHVVACSARTSASFVNNKRKLLHFLETNPETKVSDLAYTTTARRMHDVHRAAYCGETTGDIIRQIRNDISSPKSKKEPPATSSVVFVFTGQGSHYAGMGRGLFGTNKRFRDNVLSMQAICERQGFPQFADIIADGNVKIDSKTTAQVQLAIVVLEIALADIWKSWGVVPTLLVGHSLGEYAALCVSGVLSVSDTMYLVGRRAAMVQERCAFGSYAMLATASSSGSLNALIETGDFPSCHIACLNGPNSTVISGAIEDIERLSDHLQAIEVKSKLLHVPYGFHSSQLYPMLADLEACALGVDFNKPTIPIASTLSTEIVSRSGIFKASYLSRHAREPVNFMGALHTCQNENIVNDTTLWFEIGPDPLCLSMVQSTLGVRPEKLLPTLRSTEENWKTVSSAIAGAYVSRLSVNWPEYHKEHIQSLSLLELPTYSFDVKDYWVAYKGQQALKQVTAPSLSKAIPPAPQLSTCLQRVVEESFGPDKSSVTFESHTSDSKLREIIMNHVIDGARLCPSGAFCDMAYTAAKYIHGKLKPGEPLPAMSLSRLEMNHPVVVRADISSQVVRTFAVKSTPENGAVNISFACDDGLGPHEIGGCAIRFEDVDVWRDEWRKSSFFVKSRMDTLISSVTSGNGHSLRKSVLYKLFSGRVVYGDKYQAIQEAFLTNDFKEAAALVKLNACPGADEFTVSPYWTDSLVHIAGFAVNGDVTLPDDVTYLATSLQNIRIAGELSTDKTYMSYVRIGEPDSKGSLTADIYTFDGETIIAMCTGLKFQRMPKKLLRHIFGVGESKPEIELSSHLKSSTKLSSHAANTKALSTFRESSLGLVRKIISEQSKIAASFITENATFKELDVDEVQLRSIASRLRQSLRDIPDSFLMPHSTIGELRRYIDIHKDKHGLSSQGSSSQPTGGSTAPSCAEGNSDSSVINILLAIIRSETGFDADEIDDTTEFSSMGVDSLMTIAITAKLKQETGFEIGASFFTQNPTVGDMKRTLRAELGVGTETPDVATPPPTPPPEKVDPVIDPNLLCEPSRPEAIEEIAAEIPPHSSAKPKKPLSDYSSNVVLIQGRASSGKNPMFLVTDGAGSATAYIYLPRFPSGLRVYALESPFLHCPEEYTCTFEEAASIYMKALRKTKPHGPYILGGWSAGGAYAYEIARMLSEEGEVIEGLILIDMCVPRPMPGAVEMTLDFIEDVGLAVGVVRSGQPEAVANRLKQHLVSTVKAIMHYNAQPMDPARRPKNTVVVWAKYGLPEIVGEAAIKDMDNGTEIDPAGNAMEDENQNIKTWFYSKRHHFGPNGWDKLLGDVECHAMDADHFSMVTLPHARVLGKILQQSMAKWVT